MAKKIEIDWETAERITVATLKDYKKYLQKELRQYKKGAWLHPDDVVGNKARIEALTLVIRDFTV